MVWGGIYGDMKTTLYFKDDKTSINAEKYVSILKNMKIQETVC